MTNSNNTSAPADLNGLFSAATAEGTLSPASASVLQVRDLGRQIQAGLGASLDDIESSETVLVSMLIDDSSSIRFASNAQFVRDGHNLVIATLKRSKQTAGVFVHTRYLNGKVLYPFCSLDQVVLMDNANYDPSGGTPLYDETRVLLATVLAEEMRHSQAGVPSRGISLIVTDGEDCGSRKMTPAKLAPLVRDLLKTERHIVAAMGIDDGHTPFRDIFRSMGIEDRWILTPGNTESEIRRAFQLVSQSALRASQTAQAFSQTAAGGFGTP